jgi:hypothetical protein
MASAELDAAEVARRCDIATAKEEAAMAAANERGIQSLIDTPERGYWPWSKSRTRTREEAEEHYGKAEYWHCARWWTEIPYRERMHEIALIKRLAKAASGRTIRLNADEAKLVGVS